MSNVTVENSLLEEFACPVCFEYMDKKIYICINGHSFCGGCNSKLSKCPICKVKLNSKRNINLEQAAKKVKEWKTKNEKLKWGKRDIACIKPKSRVRFSVGSPIKVQPNMFLPENHIQCPHGKCCYFTKLLLELKIHLQSWHPNDIFPIKKELTDGNPGKVIQVNLCWDLISEYNLFVLSTSDALFIVFLNREFSSVKNCSYILNVLTVSDKTKMFKFTCGDVSKFSMFYQGKHQVQEGIEVDQNTIKTVKKPGGYKYSIKFFIIQVAALHDKTILEAIAAAEANGEISP